MLESREFITVSGFKLNTGKCSGIYISFKQKAQSINFTRISVLIKKYYTFDDYKNSVYKGFDSFEYLSAM